MKNKILIRVAAVLFAVGATICRLAGLDVTLTVGDETYKHAERF